MVLLEAQRVLNVVEEECTKQVKRVEIEFFDGLRHRDVTSLIKIFVLEDNLARPVVQDVASLTVNKIAVQIDRSTVHVSRPLTSSLGVHGEDDKALIISVKVAKDVNFIEISSDNLWGFRGHE